SLLCSCCSPGWRQRRTSRRRRPNRRRPPNRGRSSSSTPPARNRSSSPGSSPPAFVTCRSWLPRSRRRKYRTPTRTRIRGRCPRGVSKGMRGVRFPTPKMPAAKEGRPAAVTYADKKGKHIANVTDLQAIYRVGTGEELSPLLFFKKTIKVDLAKFKKITSLS